MNGSIGIDSAPRVLFRMAAGPRVGFRHLVRCRSLARALGVQPRVSIRGSLATRLIAAASGWSVADSSCRALFEERPTVLVIDDPSDYCTAAWVNAARRAGVPVATIHDLGLSHVASDLTIDGSILTGCARSSTQGLRGPAHMILDPDVLAHRLQPEDRPPANVLIALGGGAHVHRLAARVCDAVAARISDVQIHVAAGFSSTRRRPALARGEWVTAPQGLAEELSRTTVAIVAGGITLYEACAIGVPAIALALTPTQRLTVRAIARHGAAVDAGAPPDAVATIIHVADSTAALLADARARRRLSTAGQRLVDARGAFRVADYVRELARTGRAVDAA
jgi:spore coat polysaccharide biosynthesis predicted glycosyltransferase SpsG